MKAKKGSDREGERKRLGKTEVFLVLLLALKLPSAENKQRLKIRGLYIVVVIVLE